MSYTLTNVSRSLLCSGYTSMRSDCTGRNLVYEVCIRHTHFPERSERMDSLTYHREPMSNDIIITMCDASENCQQNLFDCVTFVWFLWIWCEVRKWCSMMFLSIYIGAAGAWTLFETDCEGIDIVISFAILHRNRERFWLFSLLLGVAFHPLLCGAALPTNQQHQEKATPLFLLISSVSTEQSQMCVRNTVLVKQERGEPYCRDNVAHCFSQQVCWWKPLDLQLRFLHKIFFCKSTWSEWKGFHNQIDW